MCRLYIVLPSHTHVQARIGESNTVTRWLDPLQVVVKKVDCKLNARNYKINLKKGECLEQKAKQSVFFLENL